MNNNITIIEARNLNKDTDIGTCTYMYMYMYIQASMLLM